MYRSTYIIFVFTQTFKRVLTDRRLLPLQSRTEKCYVLHLLRISTVFPITRQSGHRGCHRQSELRELMLYYWWSVRSIFEENSTPTDTFLRCSLLIWDLCNRFFCTHEFRCVPTIIENYKSASFRLHPVWGPARMTRSWQSQRCSLYSLAEQSGT